MRIMPTSFRAVPIAVIVGCCFVAASGGCGRSGEASVSIDENQMLAMRKPTAASAGGAATGDVGSGWGTLKGRFTFGGAAPTSGLLAGFDPNKDALCKIPVKDDSFVVDASSKGISNVLLYVRAAPRVHPDFESAAPKEVLFDQKECRFLTRVFAQSIKDKYVILNSDDPAHNSNGDPGGGNPPYNALLSPKVGRFDYPGFKKAINTPYEITCSIHPWMKAYHIARPDPYFAVSAADGTFTIEKLPAGVDLEFQVWHEKGAADKGGLVGKADGLTWTAAGRFKIKIPENGEATVNAVVEPSALAL